MARKTSSHRHPRKKAGRKSISVCKAADFIHEIEKEEKSHLKPGEEAHTDWHAWNPGIDNDAETLHDVLTSLPGAPASGIDLLIKLMENPKSPYALAGAMTLADHDCVHVLLGRGLLAQDEAFVIGYTMGAEGKGIATADVQLFKLLGARVYPSHYHFRESDVMAYELGFAFGAEAKHPVSNFNFAKAQGWKLSRLRAHFGLDLEKLRAVYRRERDSIPDTEESLRLPAAPPAHDDDALMLEWAARLLPLTLRRVPENREEALKAFRRTISLCRFAASVLDYSACWQRLDMARARSWLPVFEEAHGLMRDAGALVSDHAFAPRIEALMDRACTLGLGDIATYAARLEPVTAQAMAEAEDVIRLFNGKSHAGELRRRALPA